MEIAVDQFAIFRAVGRFPNTTRTSSDRGNAQYQRCRVRPSSTHPYHQQRTSQWHPQLSQASPRRPAKTIDWQPQIDGMDSWTLPLQRGMVTATIQVHSLRVLQPRNDNDVLNVQDILPRSSNHALDRLYPKLDCAG